MKKFFILLSFLVAFLWLLPEGDAQRPPPPPKAMFIISKTDQTVWEEFKPPHDTSTAEGRDRKRVYDEYVAYLDKAFDDFYTFDGDHPPADFDLWASTTKCIDPASAGFTDVGYCVELKEAWGKYKTIRGRTGMELIGNLVSVFYRYAASIIGIIAVLIIVIRGIQIMTGGARSESVTEAKDDIFKAIASIILLFLIGLLLESINPGFFGTPHECSDGMDNDGDGLIDMDDPGCKGGGSEKTAFRFMFPLYASVLDDGEPELDDSVYESLATTQCQDGKDNNNDGEVDAGDSDCLDDSGNYDKTIDSEGEDMSPPEPEPQSCALPKEIPDPDPEEGARTEKTVCDGTKCVKEVCKKNGSCATEEGEDPLENGGIAGPDPFGGDDSDNDIPDPDKSLDGIAGPDPFGGDDSDNGSESSGGEEIEIECDGEGKCTKTECGDEHDDTSPPSSGSKLSNEEIQDIVRFHNDARRDVGVGSLVWDANIATYAQEWADFLKDNKNCEIFDRANNSDHHRSTLGRKEKNWGENLAWGIGSPSMSFSSIVDAHGATDGWVSEKECYDYASNRYVWNNSCKSANERILRRPLSPGERGPLNTVGHYTQVVWKDTKKVGCGKQTCGEYYDERIGGNAKGIVWVCNYDPHGNITINGVKQKPY